MLLASGTLKHMETPLRILVYTPSTRSGFIRESHGTCPLCCYYLYSVDVCLPVIFTRGSCHFLIRLFAREVPAPLIALAVSSHHYYHRPLDRDNHIPTLGTRQKRPLLRARRYRYNYLLHLAILQTEEDRQSAQGERP